ncbi:MAG: hypothetical protein RR276_05870, partial [Angelakisella sp.]
MKKILALVLAVAMMATTAFAVGISSVVATGKLDAGESIVLTPDDFKDKAGAKLSAADLGTGDWKFSKDYFRISKKEIKKGSGLITSIDFDGENGKILIKTAAGTLAPDHAPNLVLGTISVAAKKNVDTIKTSATFSWTPASATGLEVMFGMVKTDFEKTVAEGDGYVIDGKSHKYLMGSNYLTLTTSENVGDFDVTLEG